MKNKSTFSLIFCLLTGAFSVNLFTVSDAEAHGIRGSFFAGDTFAAVQSSWTINCPDGTPGFWFQDRAGNVECYSLGDGPLGVAEERAALRAKSDEVQSSQCLPGEEIYGGGLFMEHPAKCVVEDHIDVASSEDCRAQTKIEHTHPGRDFPEIHSHSWNAGSGTCGHGVGRTEHQDKFVIDHSLLPWVSAPPPVSSDLQVPPLDLFGPEPAPVSVSAGTPLVRTPGAVQSPAEPVGDIVSELGIQSGGYAPVDVQQISPSAENRLPEYAAPAALLGALAFSSLYPDYSVNHSFDFSGENESVNWEAGMHGTFSHGSFSSYVSALQSDNGFVIESGTTYQSNSFFASYRTVEAKDYMNYEVQLSVPWKYSGWSISPNLSSQFHYDRDENHSSSESGAGLDLEYRF